MPLGTSKNIIVGAARVFIGTKAAAKPAFVGGTPYGETVEAAAGWRNVGYTQEGVEFSNEPEFGDVEVDQQLDSARIHKTSMRNTLNTTFAEATLLNLLVVWGQADGTLSSGATSATLTLTGGALGEAPKERQVLVVGNGVENNAGVYNERTYWFYRAISVESNSHALRRSEATVFPVSFRLLPNDNGDYGTFHERERTWALT